MYLHVTCVVYEHLYDDEYADAYQDLLHNTYQLTMPL